MLRFRDPSRQDNSPNNSVPHETKRRTRPSRKRNLRFETLELRALLTGVPVATSLSANLFGGDLWIADQPSSNQQNLLELSATEVNGVAYLRIHDPAVTFATVPLSDPASFVADNQHTLLIPQALLTGVLHIHGGGGEDTLTVDLDTGDVIPAGGIFFHGELPTTGAGDLLVIQGGEQGVVTYNYLNASDGDIELSNFGKITYTGLEPITNTGSATDVIFNLPTTTNSVTLADDGTAGNGLSRLSGGTFETTDFVNPTGSLTINRGSGSDTITTGAIPDFNASLQLGSAASPFQMLTFASGVTLGGDKSLTGFASGTISLPNNGSDVVVSGNGSISLTTASNIRLNPGASLSTENGNLTLSANRQTTATVANFIGIELADAVVQSSGTGNVTVTGRGGLIADAPELIGVLVRGSTGRIRSQNGNVQVSGEGGGTGAALFGYGVELASGGQITATGLGTVAVTGVGGASGGVDYGVLVTGTNSEIGSTSGNVIVVGTGGNSGSNNHGVVVNHSGSIAAGGAGITTVTGFGGSSGESNHGVLVAGGVVTSEDGAVHVTGTGGSGTTRNDGVAIASAGVITAGALGLVTVEGQATGTNWGVSIQSAGSIQCRGGNIFVGANSFTARGGGIATRGAASLTIAADQMIFEDATTIYAGPNTVTLKTKSASQAIELGGNDSATTLSLNDSELDRIIAGTIVFGDGDAASLTVSAAITRFVATNIVLRPGSPITITSGGSISITSMQNVITPSGSLVIDNPGFALRPLNAATDLTAAYVNFSSGSKLEIDIAGAIGNTGYSQLSTLSRINLTGADMVLTGSYVPTATDSFVIVNNVGADPMSGTFTGLAEGAIVLVNGVPMRLTYLGGSNSNDVVLLPCNRPPTITSDGGGDTATKSFFTGSTANVTTLTATDVDLPPPTFVYALAGGADQSRFTIDPNSGALRFVSPPSFNSPSDTNRDNKYEVTVQVGDGLGGFDTQTLTITVGNLIWITDRRDLIYDATRKQLLVTTSYGSLLRFDTATNTFLTPLTVGTSLNGGDITANGDFAYITEASSTGGRKIHKVNLATGAVTDLPYAESNSLELGGWDLSIASNGTALFTPLASDTDVRYFALRQINLNTDVISTTTHAAVYSGAHLDRNIDGSRILIREPAWTSGVVSGYTPIGFTALAGAPAIQTLAMGAVSPSGNFIAMEATQSVGIFDSNYQPLKYFDDWVAAGAIFHPTQNLFLTIDSTNNQLVAIDLNTFTERYRLQIGEDVIASTPLADGVMTISPDGNSVFVSTPLGARLITLPSETGPAYSADLVYSENAAAGVPTTVQVTMHNQAGNVAVDYTGTVHFSSTDPDAVLPADYTFTSADAGVKTFAYSFPTKGSKVVAVTDLDNANITATSTLFVRDTPPAYLRIDDMNDMVFDAARNVLYITTDSGLLQRYDVATDSMLRPWQVGTSLQGADLSVDGGALFVTDVSTIPRTGVLHKVDLNNGHVTDLFYPLDVGEGSGTDIGITADGMALIGGDEGGVAHFRRLNTVTGVISVVQLPGRPSGVISGARITPAADRSYLFIQDRYNNNQLFTYTSGGTFSSILKSDGIYNEMSAVNADGSLIAMELGYDMAVFNKQFQQVQELPLSGGLLFHPTQPLLLVADETSNQIIAFSTSTWEERYRVPIGEDLFSSRLHDEGELEISADGSRLFMFSQLGLRIIRLPAADGVASNVTITEQGSSLSTGVDSSFTVTIRDPAGNPVTNHTGTVHFTSTDPLANLPADYTFTPADGGKHTFDYRFGTAGTQSVTVVDVAKAALARTASVQVTATQPAFLPIPGAREFVFDSSRNVMYIIVGTGEIQRYSLTTNSLLSPWQVGHSLAGGDINVDNTALYVQDSLPNVRESVIHKIDLNTGAVTDLVSPFVDEQEKGGDLKIAANGIALGSASYTQYNAISMQQIDTTNDLLTNGIYSLVNHETHAARNRDRSLVALVMSGSSAGQMFTYNGTTGTYSSVIKTNQTLSNGFLAVNDAGTTIAISSYNRLELRNANLDLLASLTGVTGAVAFKPGTNLLFLADGNTERINVYNGDAGWTRLSSIEIGESINSEPLGEGALAFSGDGTKVFLATETGVRQFDIGTDFSPPTITNKPANQTLPEGTPSNVLTFKVNDNQTPAGQLTVSARSSNQTRIPNANIILGGSGADRTIQIFPDPDQFGAATITVTVLDQYRNATDFTVTVTTNSVNDPPTFVAGPDQSVAFGAGAQTVTGWATNIFEGAANEVSQAVALQITGNTNSALFSTQPAVSATGILTYTPAVGAFGASTITVTPLDTGGALGTPQSFVINVGSPTLFAVTAFTITTDGFVVEFNQPVDHTTLHLYETPADIVLRGTHSSTPVRGSVVVDPGLQKLTFVATDGLLPPDTYSVRLRGASDGFRDASLAPLDGDQNGLPGGDYVQSFVVSAAAPVVISLPNIVRGPGQPINVPVSATTGIPISFSNGGGLTRASFTIRYNVDWLRVTGLTVAPGMPFGATVSITYPLLSLGVANIEFRSPEPLPEGTTRFVDMQAYVPETAIYRQKGVLDITDIDLGGVAPGIGDDAMQVVAFFGDVTGNGTYSAQDASISSQLAVGINTGLESYQLLDPMIVGDITGNGTFSSTDTSLMLQAAVGIPVAEIPSPLPTISLTQGGPDPKLSIPQNLVATAGGALVIPVDIDSIVNLTGNGLASADLVIYYDPMVFEITSATLGRLVAQRGWIISSRIDPSAGRIDLSLAGTRPLEGQFLGELVRLHATVKANAPAGNSAINLAATSRSRTTQLNEGFLTLIPAPTDAANDAIDGRVTILANETAPSVENTAMLIGEQLLITGSRGDDRILVGLTIDGRLRVRIGNQLLGDFAAPAGIAVDALTGNDFVYVAPFAPPALISANLSVHDQIFGEQNSRVIDDTNDFADSNLVAQSGVLHSEALLQLLTAWQAESEADEFSPRPRSVRRLV